MRRYFFRCFFRCFFRIISPILDLTADPIDFIQLAPVGKGITGNSSGRIRDLVHPSAWIVSVIHRVRLAAVRRCFSCRLTEIIVGPRLGDVVTTGRTGFPQLTVVSEIIVPDQRIGRIAKLDFVEDSRKFIDRFLFLARKRETVLGNLFLSINQ